METLKVIAVEALDLRKGLLEVTEKVKSEMNWMETNSRIPEHLPQKKTEHMKSEMTLLEFCRKVVKRLSNEISKIMEKCQDLYKKIHEVH